MALSDVIGNSGVCGNHLGRARAVIVLVQSATFVLR
jgi:hypothetical protein